MKQKSQEIEPQYCNLCTLPWVQDISRRIGVQIVNEGKSCEQIWKHDIGIRAIHRLGSNPPNTDYMPGTINNCGVRILALKNHRHFFEGQSLGKE